VPCEQVRCRDARSMSCWQKDRVVSNFFTQLFQYFQIVNLVDCLSLWYKFIMINPSNTKKKGQKHCFDSWFGLTEFFWSRGISSLPLCTLPLHFRVVLVDSCFITCDDTAQNVILLLQKVLENCDSSLLLFFGELLWDHFCTHLPYVKISVKIFLTVSLPMFTCSAMLLTVNRRFSRTIWQHFAMFSSVLLVVDRPDLSSLLTLSLPSEKRFTHLFSI